MTSTLNKVKHTSKEFKNYCQKIQIWVKTFDQHKRILDSPTAKSENSAMSSRLLAMKLNSSTRDFNSLQMSIKGFLTLKTRLQCFHNKLRDSTPLLKRRIMKLELWAEKFKIIKKILDYQQPKIKN